MKLNTHQRMYYLRLYISELQDTINNSRDNFLREELASIIRKRKKQLNKMEIEYGKYSN